jgi:hypothetical protein
LQHCTQFPIRHEGLRFSSSHSSLVCISRHLCLQWKELSLFIRSFHKLI